MTIKIYYGGNVEILTERLCENIFERSAEKGDPFCSIVVATPNRSLGKWLQLRISEKNGISMNIHFPFFEKALTAMLSEISGVQEFINEMTLRQMIAASLYTCAETGNYPDELEILLDYFKTAGVTDSSMNIFSMKIWQIAGCLSGVFREYEYQRGSMIKAWRKGRNIIKPDNVFGYKMEKGQMRLYNGIFEKAGLLDGYNKLAGIELKNIFHYLYSSESVEKKIISNDEMKKIYIFAPPKISQFHSDLMLKLGHYCDLELYILNVCREYWDDITTVREDKYLKRKNRNKTAEKSLQSMDSASIISESGITDNSLLKIFGKAGRENIKILNNLEERCLGYTEFNSEWLEQDTSKDITVLKCLKEMIFLRTDDLQTAVNVSKIHQDDSLRIFNSADRFRELETVYNSILFHMRHNPDLNFNDFAIIAPDIKKYRTAVHSVFQGNYSVIPFNMIDTSVSEESIFGDALLRVLNIADSEFSRKEIIELLMNPCIREMFKIDKKQLDDIIDVIDKLNVYLGFDLNNKSSSQSMQTDIFTWEKGFQRLRFSKIMPAPSVTAEFSEIDFFQNIIPNAAGIEAENNTIGILCLIVEYLNIIKNKIHNNTKFKISKWREIIEDIIVKFIKIPEELKRENTIRTELANFFESAENFDDFCKIQNPDYAGVNSNFIIQFLKSGLADSDSGIGRHLIDGVTISSIKQLRPVSFKILYIIGLNENDFPGRAGQSIIDLRYSDPKPDDIFQTDLNRYLFLEALAGAGEKLYLSYISRDLQKDEELHSSSIINQIRNYIEQFIIGHHFRICETPLSGENLKYFSQCEESDFFPDIMVNFSKMQAGAAYLANVKKENGLENILINKIRSSIINFEHKAPAENLNINQVEKKIEKIQITALRDYILNPGEAVCKKKIGTTGEFEKSDIFLNDDEPFSVENLVKSKIIINVSKYFVYNFIKEKNTDYNGLIEKTMIFYDKTFDFQSSSGELPEGAYKIMAKNKLRIEIKESMRHIYNIISEIIFEKFYDFISIGGHGLSGMDIRRDNFLYSELKLKSKRFPPLEINIEKKSLEINAVITGALQFVWISRDLKTLNVLILSSSKLDDNLKIPKKVIPVFLFFLCLKIINSKKSIESEKEFSQIENLKVYLTHKPERDTFYKEFNYSVTTDEAVNYIKNLTASYLTENRIDLLPFDIIALKSSYNYFETFSGDENNEENEKYRRHLNEIIDVKKNSQFNPYQLSPLFELAKLEVPGDSLIKVTERIKPIIDKQQ